jgi:hypothetical protein
MGNVLPPRPVQLPYNEPSPHGQYKVNNRFWDDTGIHWMDKSTQGILDYPHKAFGPIPDGAHGDTAMALAFDQHVSSTLCGMIRSRAFQLNSQAYPSDRNFYQTYKIRLGSTGNWDGERVRLIIDRLRFKCGPPSGRHQQPDVGWVGHECYIHHLPRDKSNVLQLHGRHRDDPRLEDRATVDYMPVYG